MKLYFIAGLVVVILAVLVLLAPGQSVDEEVSSTQMPSAHVFLADDLADREVEKQPVGGVVSYTVFVYDNEFSPATMLARVGDTVKLTFATGNERPKDSGVEVLFDFNLPEFGVATVVDTAQEVEFVADKAGEFNYFCMTCSPQVYGTLLVTE